MSSSTYADEAHIICHARDLVLHPFVAPAAIHESPSESPLGHFPVGFLPSLAEQVERVYRTDSNTDVGARLPSPV